MGGYILIFDDTEYVESYDLSRNEVTTSGVRKDAMEFKSKGEAECIAERIGCKVIND